MKLLEFNRITERDGWLHKGVVEIRSGVIVTIVDDTDTVSAYSDQATVEEASDAWSRFAFGCSHFPDNAGSATKKYIEVPYKQKQIMNDVPGEEIK